jgi:hypothetical protein
MTSYDKIRQRCAEDPEYRRQYLDMRAEINKRARQRKAAAKTQEQREEEERRRVEAVKAANARRVKSEAPLDGVLSWKKSKPGRIVAGCGWRKWGW